MFALPILIAYALDRVGVPISPVIVVVTSLVLVAAAVVSLPRDRWRVDALLAAFANVCVVVLAYLLWLDCLEVIAANASNPRASERTADSNTFLTQPIIERWLASQGRPYAIADWRVLPAEIRNDADVVAQYGGAAVISSRRAPVGDGACEYHR